jgi:hypothetical protein
MHFPGAKPVRSDCESECRLAIADSYDAPIRHHVSLSASGGVWWEWAKHLGRKLGGDECE